MPVAITACTTERVNALRILFADYGLQIVQVPLGCAIPGSYWGDSEAGLIGNRLFLRTDTPLHSALHEACHFICMDDARRDQLHTDAGGDVDEENAVCYLQGLLADRLRDYDRQTLFSDMDTWGYSFRLGSAQAWFDQDATDASSWLVEQGIINVDRLPTGLLRH